MWVLSLAWPPGRAGELGPQLKAALKQAGEAAWCLSSRQGPSTQLSENILLFFRNLLICTENEFFLTNTMHCQRDPR